MNDNRYILKGKDCTNRVQSFRKLLDGKYEIVFKGSPKRWIYRSDNVRVEKSKNELIKSTAAESTKLIDSCLKNKGINEKFKYFKDIAREISLYTEEGINILGVYYDKISFIREDTVLAEYFKGVIEKNYKSAVKKCIFPFGFNSSQKIATENAMNHKLSVIQGPPGTGKTQTILNIIANIIQENKTVAVVSNNNSAIDNINEKLQEYEVDFIAARLGSTQNKKEFILNQHVPSKEKLDLWSNIVYDDADTDRLINQINEILDNRNEMARLSSELDGIETEKRYFDAFDKAGNSKLKPLIFRKNIFSDRLLDLWQELAECSRRVKRLPFWMKIKIYFIYKVKIDEFFKQDFADMISFIQRTYYVIRIKEIRLRIKQLADYIKETSLDEKMAEYKKISRDIFQSHIARKYLSHGERKHYSLEDLWKNSENFINDYPVVLSTTYSLRTSLSYNYIYDYVVIDESSQVDLATFVLALSCARRAVIVGDEKQLPNVVTSEIYEKDKKIFSKYNISEKYMFSKHSALSTITALFGNKIPSQLLREHYRCHPKIIDFCNKTFYGNQLIVLTDSNQKGRDPLKIYTTVKGNHARNDHVNQRQIDVTFNEVVPNEGLDLLNNTVGIITPYRNQAKALGDKLSSMGADKTVLAATVDKFQGRERDVIIINTVDNEISDFASNPNRLNVAISRAKNQLIVVTSGNDDSAHNGINELLDYIRYNNFEVVESKTRSVFDYLYTAYYKRRTVKRVSDYYSENLMFDLINQVIREDGYTSLECITQYPLKMLCDVTSLSGRDFKYANNHWTLIDFVIFKKTSKVPVLAIEVDGWKYHQANTVQSKKQKERDLNKDRILEKFNIPLIRFSTTGSNEAEKLSRKLKELIETSV